MNKTVQFYIHLAISYKSVWNQISSQVSKRKSTETNWMHSAKCAYSFQTSHRISSVTACPPGVSTTINMESKYILFYIIHLSLVPDLWFISCKAQTMFTLLMSMGWDYVSELRSPTDLSFIPHMTRGSHGGMILTGQTEDIGDKSMPVPLYSPQILDGLTRVQTLVSGERGRRLTE
jgi:hypothetical protein